MSADVAAMRERVAVRFREARAAAELSQQAVADALGIHRPAVSEIEAGRRRVHVEELYALAELTGFSVSDILGDLPLHTPVVLACRVDESVC